jgi:phosphatidylserine/phosphatidylglycerophosphate/cardiolipin synthase-like enzyme
MKKINFLISGCLLISLISCSTSMNRSPSSILENKAWDDLKNLKQQKIEMSALSVHFKKKKDDKNIAQNEVEQKSIDQKINEIELNLKAFDSNNVKTISNNSLNWRIEKEKIELNNLSLYEVSNNVVLPVSVFEVKETKISLTHNFFSSAGYKQMGDEEKPAMDFKIKCDAPFQVKYGFNTRKINENNFFSFSLGDKKISRDSRELIFNSNMKECELKFSSSVDYTRKEYGFKIANETKQLEALKPLISTTDICTLKEVPGEFFNTTEFSNMTCPNRYDSITLLPEPEDSLHARVVSLLGQDLPSDFVKNGNPFAELDFKNAPKYDAILVSYLVFRADFYGTLIGRLLAHHADQGALVRILVSDVITLKKDDAMYEKLMAKHPNMKFSKYKFDNSQKGGALVSELHRTNHVKLFAAYSKENPKDSFVIVGGRNIHDGFVFKTPVDVSKYPEVVNYVSGDESWAYWRDFEMVIRGQDFVESAVRNYMNFYHMNKENLVMKISSVAAKNQAAEDTKQKSLRHYVSIPFKDEPNLNLFYARMIDSSKKKILISSPYFRPVKEIAEAIDRAIARGVDITIITRLDLEGDTADFILGAVNKEGVNRFIQKVKVFEYIEPKVILHSKLLMIDEEFSFISSVNLNKRSFYHDLENGVVVNDRKFTIQMGELYKEYLQISKQLTTEQKVVFWKKWIITVFDKVL